MLEQLLDRAGVDDLAAVLAGTRADVDDPVGGLDRLLVVLDDDQGVAEVLEPDQGLDQPLVVALVQADARLVEDVEHAHQAGADLGGQADALGLAAGQGGRGPVEREVVEPDVEQEAQPLLDLLEHPLGDLALARGQLEVGEEVGGLVDRQRRRPRRCSCRPRPCSPSVTAIETGLRRVPWQAGHGTSRMKPSKRSRLVSLSASR